MTVPLFATARAWADDPVPAPAPSPSPTQTAIRTWGWEFVPVVQDGRVIGFQGWPESPDTTVSANFTSVWLARSQTNQWTVYGMRGGSPQGLSVAILNAFGDDVLDAALTGPPEGNDPLSAGEAVPLVLGLPADDPLVGVLPPCPAGPTP